MKKLNETINVFGVEAIAGSRVLLGKADSEMCLQVVLDDNEVNIPTFTPLKTGDIISFNAFKGTSSQQKENFKLLLEQRLSDEDIEAINKSLD